MVEQCSKLLTFIQKGNSFDATPKGQFTSFKEYSPWENGCKTSVALQKLCQVRKKNPDDGIRLFLGWGTDTDTSISA